MMRIGRTLSGTAALVGTVWAALALGCAKDVRSIDTILPAPQTSRPIALDVENFRGDVFVRVVTSRSDILVGGEVYADSDAPDEDKKAIDEAVQVSAVMEDRAGTPTLVVRDITERKSADHFADLDIELPSCEGVRIVNGGGVVDLVGVRGAIDVRNESGIVEIRTNQPLVAPVSLRVGSGNVYYQAPLTSTGKFDVHTDDGAATWKAADPSALAAPLLMTKGAFTVTLNQGQNPVVIRTGKGDVTVLLMDDAQSRVRTRR